MKIALIVRRLNVKGGTQRQALSFAQELVRRGHEVTIYTFWYDPASCYEDLCRGLVVQDLGEYPAGRNAVADFFAVRRVARALAARIASDTEFLNPHDQVSFLVAYYYKKRIRNIPSVWMMNDMPTRCWGSWRDREVGGVGPVSLLRRLIHRVLDVHDVRAARAQNGIAVLDERDRQWVRDHIGKDAVVVRSGIDLTQFFFRPREMRGTPLQLLMSGIFFPHRRFEDGIEAAGGVF